MTQHYEQIREALVALLCVGDKINYVTSINGGFNHKTRLKMPYNMVSKCLIIDVFRELNMIRIENFGHASTTLPGIIEMCDGELYVWNNRAYEDLSTREEMIAKLTEIIRLKKHDTGI